MEFSPSFGSFSSKPLIQTMATSEANTEQQLASIEKEAFEEGKHLPKDKQDLYKAMVRQGIGQIRNQIAEMRAQGKTEYAISRAVEILVRDFKTSNNSFLEKNQLWNGAKEEVNSNFHHTNIKLSNVNSTFGKIKRIQFDDEDSDESATTYMEKKKSEFAGCMQMVDPEYALGAEKCYSTLSKDMSEAQKKELNDFIPNAITGQAINGLASIPAVASKVISAVVGAVTGTIFWIGADSAASANPVTYFKTMKEIAKVANGEDPEFNKAIERNTPNFIKKIQHWNYNIHEFDERLQKKYHTIPGIVHESIVFTAEAGTTIATFGVIKGLSSAVKKYYPLFKNLKSTAPIVPRAPQLMISNNHEIEIARQFERIFLVNSAGEINTINKVQRTFYLAPQSSKATTQSRFPKYRTPTANEKGSLVPVKQVFLKENHKATISVTHRATSTQNGLEDALSGLKTIPPHIEVNQILEDELIPVYKGTHEITPIDEFIQKTINQPYKVTKIENPKNGNTLHKIDDLHGKPLAFLKEIRATRSKTSGFVPEIISNSVLRAHRVKNASFPVIQDIGFYEFERAEIGLILYPNIPGNTLTQSFERKLPIPAKKIGRIYGEKGAISSSLPIPKHYLEGKKDHLITVSEGIFHQLKKLRINTSLTLRHVEAYADNMMQNPGSAGLVHGDASPDNLIIGNTGKITVIDTGSLVESVNRIGEPHGMPVFDQQQLIVSMTHLGAVYGYSELQTSQIIADFLSGYRELMPMGSTTKAAEKFARLNFEMFLLFQLLENPVVNRKLIEITVNRMNHLFGEMPVKLSNETAIYNSLKNAMEPQLLTAEKINMNFSAPIYFPSLIEAKTMPLTHLHDIWAQNQETLLGIIVKEKIPRFSLHGTTYLGAKIIANTEKGVSDAGNFLWVAGVNSKRRPLQELAALCSIVEKSQRFVDKKGGLFIIDPSKATIAEDSFGLGIEDLTLDTPQQMRILNKMDDFSYVNELQVTLDPSNHSKAIKGFIAEEETIYPASEVERLLSEKEFTEWNILIERIKIQETLMTVFEKLGVTPNANLLESYQKIGKGLLEAKSKKKALKTSNKLDKVEDVKQVQTSIFSYAHQEGYSQEVQHLLASISHAVSRNPDNAVASTIHNKMLALINHFPLDPNRVIAKNDNLNAYLHTIRKRYPDFPENPDVQLLSTKERGNLSIDHGDKEILILREVPNGSKLARKFKGLDFLRSLNLEILEVPELIGLGLEENSQFLVMEHLKGKNLQQIAENLDEYAKGLFAVGQMSAELHSKGMLIPATHKAKDLAIEGVVNELKNHPALRTLIKENSEFADALMEKVEALLADFKIEPGSLTYNYGVYDPEKFLMTEKGLTLLDSKKVGTSYDGRLRPLKFASREYHAFALKNIYQLGVAKGLKPKVIEKLYSTYKKGYQKNFSGSVSKPAEKVFELIHLLDKIKNVEIQMEETIALILKL